MKDNKCEAPYKEMVYKPVQYKRVKGRDYKVAEILYSGTIDGFDFNIVSFGCHPTAYVRLPKEHPYFGKDCDDMNDIDVHGGLTFSE